MKPVSKRIRFEVFKRDSFTCQYCGRKAPDILLHLDHVNPRAKGGDNNPLNLITSCIDCNLGKADRTLADDSVLRLKQDQLAALQERREQINMMLEWQQGLAGLESETIEKLASIWCEIADWVGLSDLGLAEVRKLYRRHGFEAVAEAMRAAVDYFQYNDDGSLDEESTKVAFRKIKSICGVRASMKEKPWLRDLFYIRKIVENRCSYFNPHQARELLEEAFEAAIHPENAVEGLKYIAQHARNWSDWKEQTANYTNQLYQLRHRAEQKIAHEDVNETPTGLEGDQIDRWLETGEKPPDPTDTD